VAAEIEDVRRAAEVETTYRVCEGVYLLGSLERGLTVYNQQVRAHNLIWALWELHRRGDRPIGRVAIVGGGIAGLTAAACLLSRFETKVPVALFEQLWDLCPLQQGADGRWLHPRIYAWPRYGSRAPGASLPVLNWSEGRASDVARTVVREFGEYCEEFAQTGSRLSVVLGLRHFQIKVADLEIEWIGTRASRAGSFFQLGEAEGKSARFETIIMAAGFGLERVSGRYPTPSYWRNEQLGQPVLDGSRIRYVVSGSGDGALIDLCRLTIERFRQDTIVYELFGSSLESIEERFTEELKADFAGNIYPLLWKVEAELLSDAREELAKRLRKDTAVALHLNGKDGNEKPFPSIFGATSSVLSRLLTFLLYRCGAFSISFSDLSTCVRRQGASREHVLCRHGADTISHLKAMIVDHASIETRVAEMQNLQAQVSRRLWRPGTFPATNRGSQR
jgi:hypothetical protein